MRIISLLPGATEILYELGLADQIIGVSDDCKFPPQVSEKRLASETRLPADMSSAAIHEATEQMHRSGSIYHIDPSFLREAQPDLIIAQDVCEVCAVTSDQAQTAAREALCDAPVVSLSARTIEEILGTVDELGRLTSAESEASSLRERMEQELDEIRRAVAGVDRVRTFYIGWLDPLMCEGHWVPEMIDIAGGVELVGKAGEYGVAVDWERVRELAPELVFVAPCSFDLQKTRSEIDVLERLPGWADTPAAIRDRVFAADSGSFSTPGPRIVAGTRMFARALHPERFPQTIDSGLLAKRRTGVSGAVEWLDYA